MTPAGPDDGTARDRSQPEADAGVLAVVVTAGNTPFLAETLSGLASQVRQAEIVLVVDVASRANGLGDGTPIEEVVEACGLDASSAVRIVRAGEVATFGAAIASGLAAYTDLVASGGRRRGRSGGSRDVPEGAHSAGVAPDPVVGALSPVTRQERRLIVPDPEEQQSRRLWLWLLHDDSAPQPGCLRALLAAAANARSVGVVGPKQVSWDHPDQLLEVGLGTTASARRDNAIVPGEVDQGQYDDRSDVLAVGTAGALVARTVWDEVGGIAPWLGPFGDGLELSRAARLCGYRVVVEPQAVLRHRRASYLGLRPARQAVRRESDAPVTDLPDPAPERSFRERRVAQLTNWGAFSSRPVVLLLGWFLLLGLARGLWRLVSKVPALARDEVAAACEVLRHAGRIRTGRRRLSRYAQVPRSALGRLYVPASRIRAARRDQVRQERERSARSRAPSELEVRELAALARTRRRVLVALVLPVLVVTAAGLSGVVLTRSVSGGASAFLSTSWREMWETAWAAWIPSGDGYPGGPSPLLAVMALPMALGGLVGVDGDVGVHALLLAAVPLAALGAWFAAGTVTRRVGLRWAAGLVWALTPNLLTAVGQGRLTAVLVHLALPWMLLAVARALGADRRDVVVSGLVGAHLLTDRERQELDLFSQERVEDLAHLDQDAPGEDLQPVVDPVAGSGMPEDVQDGRHQDGQEQESAQGGEAGREDSQEGDRGSQDSPGSQGEDGTGVQDHPPAQDLNPSGPDTEGAVGGVAGTSSHRVPMPVRYGPGSAAAAATAGLLASVVVAASAATAPLLLLVIGVLALRSSRGYRLLLTLVPLVLTAAPAWWRAWQVGSTTTWSQGLRLLLTDTGVPTAVGSPSGVDLLLGSPTDLDLVLADGALALVGRILLAVVPAAALASLLVSGRQGARARTGVLLALGGLALAALSSRTVTAVGTSPGEDTSVLVTGWAGAGLSVALAGFVLAGLVAGDACLALLDADAVLRAGARGWRPWVVAVLCLVVAAGPLTAGAAWAWRARAGSEQAVALRSAGQQVPLIAAQLQSSGTQGRVLHLAASPAGLQVTIWRHAGTQVTDVLPEVLSAQLRTRVPDVWDHGLVAAEGALPDDVPMVLGDDADLALADLVARAVSGQDEEAAAELAAHGIAVVVLAETPGDELTAETRSGLASTPGLDQLAQTASGTAWRVAPQQGQEASRLTVVDADGRSVPLSSDGGEVAASARLPRGQDGRTLVLAERASSSWSASLDGTPLEPTTLPGEGGEWRQAFVLPADEGILEITYRGGLVPTLLTYGIWGAWLVTAVAALPLRRGRETV
ncbi:glycosyltransferase family 2 protein [Actinomyces sp. 2119]|uniref:glycosyltransferase n=1 Tax=Actinomyces sp. 2119 TaxID=2321393 RepID=UPI000E6C0E3E|nr:glycosyltransferase family 2 protein [Actinomyces sp. 2119]